MEKGELGVFSSLKDKINVVFDVGCRTDLDYFDIHPNCEYHLFEPNKEFVDILSVVISDIGNRGGLSHLMRLNNFGLSDKSAKDCVYYSNVQSFIINPVVGGADAGHRFDLSTLDEYVVENNIDFIDLLKIDTEGLDYLVLSGGVNTINSDKIRFIQIEYWDKPDKFYELLKDRYDMYLILEAEIIGYMPTPTETLNGLSFTTKINEVVLKQIMDNLLANGMGGNIFCVNKNIK